MAVKKDKGVTGVNAIDMPVAEAPKDNIANSNLLGTNYIRPSMAICPGQKVSLNCTIQSGYNAFGLELNRGNPHGHIPMNADLKALSQFHKSVMAGILLIGHIETVEKGDKTVLNRYLAEIDKGSPEAMRDAVIGLTKTTTRISGWEPVEILKRMHAKERSGRARARVMLYLEEAIRCHSPIGPVSEEFNEKIHARASQHFDGKKK